MWHEMDEKLGDAAKCGDVGEVERLIAGGADVNSLVDGMTPLHKAAENGHVAVIGALVKGGAHVDGEDEDGWTPLMWAAAAGHAAALEALVAAGADANHATICVDITALHVASSWGRLAAARVLLEAGAKADVHILRGKRPIGVVRGCR